MPTFLDAHQLGGVTEEQLRKAQAAPVGQDGVRTVNILYNTNENKAFCVTEAPNREAVEKHHQDVGMKCDWITEVKTTA
jgi:Protein of unknown function (DUF4242)